MLGPHRSGPLGELRGFWGQSARRTGDGVRLTLALELGVQVSLGFQAHVRNREGDPEITSLAHQDSQVWVGVRGGGGGKRSQRVIPASDGENPRF